MPFSYTFTDLYRVCLRINTLIPSFVLSGHKVIPRLVYVREFTAGKLFDVVSDDQYEINICLSGEATVSLEKSHHVAAGSIVYQGPQQVSHWQVAKNSMLIAYLRVTVNPFVNLPEPAQWPVWSFVLQDMMLIIEESRQNSSGWPERAGWRLATTLSRVISRSPDLHKPEKPPSYAHDYLLNVVENYLIQHMALPITIDDVAAHAQVSRRTVMREFHRRSGETIMERLTKLRMEAAVYCLLKTSLPLADIAVQVGISDTNYFNRVFHRHVGTSPLRYRKMKKAEQMNDHDVINKNQLS